jgi:chromate transporter
MVIVLALAWDYVTYGSLPQAQWLLYGIKPVIIAIVAQALYGLAVAQALYGLARTALKGPALLLAAAAVLALYLLGVNELALLFGAGSVAAAIVWTQRRLTRPRPESAAPGGSVAGGVAAALLATVGIFLPSFVFVARSGPLVPHVRRWPLTAALLDGVNAAALGLMAAVTITLARAALVELPTSALAVLSLVILVRWKVNSDWLVLGGALAGLIVRALS